MPAKSLAQLRYINAYRAEMEKQGMDVDEWNEASKGKELPEHVKIRQDAIQRCRQKHFPT